MYKLPSTDQWLDQGKWYRVDIIQQLRCITDTCELCKWQCKAYTEQRNGLGQYNVGKCAEIQSGLLCKHNSNKLHNLSGGFILCRKCNSGDGMRNRFLYKCNRKKCMYGMFGG